MRRLGRGVCAFALGTVVLFAVQILITKFWELLEVTWGNNNLPFLSVQQIAALATLFLAIFIGSYVAAMISKNDAWKVLTVMALVGLLIDGYAMFVKLADLPTWFKITFVATIPVATLLAWLLASQLLKEHVVELGDA